MITMSKTFFGTWEQCFRDKRFRIEFAFTVLVLCAILIVFSGFLKYVESRTGIALPDPVLSLFDPRDATWVTFVLIYLALVIAVIFLMQYPRQLVLALQSYGIMVLFRMAAMFMIPLEPPARMIPLNDPFVEFFAGHGNLLTKDLFFSGHTSTMFLLFLTARKLWQKGVFLMCSMFVAGCVLLQHVHYAIDILAAPFFAYCSYRIARLVHTETTP